MFHGFGGPAHKDFTKVVDTGDDSLIPTNVDDQSSPAAGSHDIESRGGKESDRRCLEIIEDGSEYR